MFSMPPSVETSPANTLCLAARDRLLSQRGEPCFLANWSRALFLHFEVDSTLLQKECPFELDLYQGRALVSLVAFTMQDLRPYVGGKWTAWILKPIATHPFLNVRTYVRHENEPGILFLAEWLSNRLSVRLGPGTFGLPYRYGKPIYHHQHEQGELHGSVKAQAGTLAYHATLAANTPFHHVPASSLAEFLLERYTAYTWQGATRRYFRVWHWPWEQCAVEPEIMDRSLLNDVWPWFKEAQFVGAHYSPGVRNVWMGRPHRVR